MYQKVMVVINPEANHQIALDKALQLARTDDFELLLFSCDHTQYLVEGYYFDAVNLEKLRAEYVAARLKLLEEIAEPLRENGLNVSTSAVWSYPNYEGVVSKASAEGVDLIIYHVERSGTFSRVLLTHDDWQLVRLAPAPILLVKDTPWKPAPTMIAAVDPQHARHKPSGLDHKILNHSKALSELMGGELYALHAFHPIPFSGEYPLEARKSHEASFAGLMADFDVPKDHQMLIEESPVFALQQAEEQVVDYLKCDILALKPDHHGE